MFVKKIGLIGDKCITVMYLDGLAFCVIYFVN